jgi:hypothetical protein
MALLEVLFYVFIGGAVGYGLTEYLKRKPASVGPDLYSKALMVASFIYVAFAMASMEDGWLMASIGGVLLFLIFVFLGSRRSVLWLAAGWFAHIAWDLAIHVAETVNFVPLWYPLACIGFDAVVGSAILFAYLRVQKAERMTV